MCLGRGSGCHQAPSHSRLPFGSPHTVPPSKPDCSIQGETVIGNNIQLTCQSKEGSPAPQYSWKSYNVLHQERQVSAGKKVCKEGQPPTSRCRWCGQHCQRRPWADQSDAPEGCPSPPAFCTGLSRTISLSSIFSHNSAYLIGYCDR